MSSLIQSVEFTPAFDKRHTDPGKNYGIGSVTMRCVLRGPAGAVQFVLYTGWDLPHVREELKEKRSALGPMAADLGYHSPVPMYDGQLVQNEACAYVGGKPCYYDGSGLNAQPVFDLLVSEGHEAMWKYLANYYASLFPVAPPAAAKAGAGAKGAGQE